MNAAQQPLLALASKQFPDLTESEKKLVHNLVLGSPADYCSQDQAKNDPKNSKDWGESRMIRAVFLRWLCSDERAIRNISGNGINIRGAKIDGELNLQAASIPLPLFFYRCATPGPVLLNSAETRGLSFAGCVGGRISGDRLVVQGDLSLQGFQSEGAVVLTNARVIGNWDCEGARFLNPSQDALIADGITVFGRASLGRGFYADGAVLLKGATIRGPFECANGVFHNPKAIALNADGIAINGAALLHEGFRAEGEVRLVGATISGSLDCEGGTFQNSGGIVLNADGITINGAALLHQGFQAKGEVRLVGATISGSLDCERGTFQNPGGIALNAEGIVVRGSALLQQGFRAEGDVRLAGATITGSLDCEEAWRPNREPAFRA
jgi:hypothetical protein